MKDPFQQKGIRMNTNNWKKAAEEDPTLLIAAGGVAAVLITALAKLVNAASAAQGRRAYAKMVKHSTKK